MYLTGKWGPKFWKGPGLGGAMSAGAEMATCCSEVGKEWTVSRVGVWAPGRWGGLSAGWCGPGTVEG